jgi:RHS repeat-associated protein
LKSTTNALGQILQLAYDDLDRLVSATDPLSQVSKQSYDADGNRISLTNARSATTSFAFDLGGRMTSVTVPGPRVTTYAYDARNLPTTITEPSGQQTRLTYDDAGRLKQSVDPTGTIDYTYDAAGRLLTVKQGTATITRAYDDVGRLTQFTDASGNVLKYAYDAAGNLTVLTYPDGKTVTYTYDAANRLVSVLDWAGRVTTYGYDPDGRLATTARRNGTVEKRTWLPTGELASLADFKGTTAITQFTFNYDLAGRIVAENPLPAPAAYTPAAFTATYDTGNRLTAFNGVAAAFDADGNMTTGPKAIGTGTGAFTYDSRNRLTSYGGTSYSYDAENRRTSWMDASGTTKLVTNPNAALTQVLVRTSPTGVVTRAVYGLGLIYEETNSLPRYYHYDYRGSAIAFTDASGTVIGRVEYGPYGELSKRTNDTATPYLVSGRYGIMSDPNSLVYMRARYYHPNIRRFLNQDPVLGEIDAGISLNRFSFAAGNPTCLIDPDGFCPIDSNLNDAIKIAKDIVEWVEHGAKFGTRLLGGYAYRRFDWWSAERVFNSIDTYSGMTKPYRKAASDFFIKWGEPAEKLFGRVAFGLSIISEISKAERPTSVREGLAEYSAGSVRFLSDTATGILRVGIIPQYLAAKVGIGDIETYRSNVRTIDTIEGLSDQTFRGQNIDRLGQHLGNKYPETAEFLARQF